MSHSASHSGVGAETACTARRRMSAGSLFFVAALLLAVLGGCGGRRDAPGASADAAKSTTGQFLLSVRNRAAGERGGSPLLAIVLHEDRLTCAPCLESLEGFFDSLRGVPRELRVADIMLIVSGSGGNAAVQLRRMEAWSDAHRLTYPLSVISADSLREKFLGQSSVLFVDGEGVVRLDEPIPLAPGAIGQIMHHLCGR